MNLGKNNLIRTRIEAEVSKTVAFNFLNDTNTELLTNNSDNMVYELYEPAPDESDILESNALKTSMYW